MVVKNGFLLIELLISFTLTLFFIFITTHYIVEIKKIQHAALARVELVSYARNCVEKIIAGKKITEKDVRVTELAKNIVALKAIDVQKKDLHQHCSTRLLVCTPLLEIKQTGEYEL